MVWVKVRVSSRIEGNRAITSVENCPRLGVGLGLGLVLGLGGQLSPEAIVLEPQKPLGKIKKKVNKKRLTKKVLKDTLKAYFW